MNTTNTILIILLVILVGFGVWYFTVRQPAPAPVDQRPNIEVRVDTPDMGADPADAAAEEEETPV